MTVGGSSDVYRKEGFYGSSTRKDGRRVILVITSSEKKQKEIAEHFGHYGCNVVFMPTSSVSKHLTAVHTPADVQHPDAIAAVTDIAATWNVENTATPQFVLREECRLSDLRRHGDIDPADVIDHPEKYASMLMQDRSFLACWCLHWSKESGKLESVSARWFEHAAHGFIDPARASKRTPESHGWDHIYVLPQLGLSYDELKAAGPCGKIASRQLTLSSFTMQYLLYDKPKQLTHNRALSNVFERAVQFDVGTSVAKFVRENEFLSNPHLQRWGLKRFLDTVIDEGIFFRAAASRPMGNFFCPPLSGVPLTSKKDHIEETVFMCHDIGHMRIPDLQYCGEDMQKLPEDERRSLTNVYCIWRMMSEATTMMLADCLYASTVAEMDPKHIPCLDKRIFPLWQRLEPRVTAGSADRWTAIKRLLWANTKFALLGDTSEFENLLDASCEKDKAALAAFVGHFAKFFVGDTVWTRINFDNMTSKNHLNYKTWSTEIVGAAPFAAAGLPTINDVVAALKKRGVVCSGDYDVTLVRAVWEYIMDSRMAPIFSSSSGIESGPPPLSDEQRISKGFYRYVIGQAYFYGRFSSVLPVMKEKGRALMAAMDKECGGDPARLSAEAIQRVTAQYHSDVRYVWGMGVLSAAAAEEYCQIHPLFEPAYVSYASIMETYPTIAMSVSAMHPKKKS